MLKINKSGEKALHSSVFAAHAGLIVECDLPCYFLPFTHYFMGVNTNGQAFLVSLNNMLHLLEIKMAVNMNELC